MKRPLTLACFVSVFAALAAVVLTSRSAPALAHPLGANAAYTVHVEDEWGSPLRTFHKGGQTFVLGSYGQRYNVRVRNQTGQRVEAVITVDGRDVVSGRVGDFVGERGYVIEPYGTLKVEGFRRSLSEVAAFRFSSPGESYSARMGTPENVGVIGVAFFPERPRPAPRPRPYLARPYDEGARSEARRSSRSKSGLGTMSDSNASAGAPASAAPAERQRSYEAEDAPTAESDSVNNLGTEYGESYESHVQEVAFRRADPTHPAQVVALRYDDEQGLLARGIRLHAPPVQRFRDEPVAFPRNRFAPPPP